MVYIGAL